MKRIQNGNFRLALNRMESNRIQLDWIEVRQSLAKYSSHLPR